MPRGRHDLKIETLDRASAIVTLPRELEELAERALEPNVFNEALMLIPALELIDVAVPVHIVCIRDGAGRLVGVVPLTKDCFQRPLPLTVLRSWSHRYCFLDTPILDAGCARQAIEALADWIASADAPGGAIEWSKMAWDGPVGRVLKEAFGRRGGWDVMVSERALLDRSQKVATGGRHTRQWGRMERRLAEQGQIHYTILQPSEDWRPWYEEFLEVEASGWKGREGSAIASRAEDREFFRRVLQYAHPRGRTQLLRMAVGDKTIAMKLNLRARGTSYSLKIGHDERFDHYSPGVLLELFNIKAFSQEPDDILTMDSCAVANHPMMNRLWSGRKQIALCTLARRGLMVRSYVKLRPVVRRVRDLIREKIKRPEQAR